MKPTTLRVLLICTLLGVQVATVLGLMLGLERQATDQFSARSHQAIAQLADSFSNSVRAFLDPVEKVVRLTGELVDHDVLGVENPHALEELFLAQMRLRPSLKSLHLGRADGSFLAAYRDGDDLRFVDATALGADRVTRHLGYDAATGASHELDGEAFSYDPRERPWYLQGASSRDLAWTGAFPLYGLESLGMSAVRRIDAADGSLLGVIGAAVEMGELSSYIARVPSVPGGTAVLFDREQHVLAFSDYQHMRSALRPGVDGPELPYMDDVVGLPLKTLATRIDAIGDPVAASSNGFLYMEVEGREHVGIARPMTLSSGGVDWTLYVQAPADALWGSVREVFDDSLWIMLTVISLSTLVAVVTVMRLTAPVYDLHRSATVDDLTGALTRAEFDRRLEAMLDAHRSGDVDRRIALMALDLDGFKQVNDGHGHAAGDGVLVEFVARLRARLRDGDLIGRVGGDEFVAALQLDPDGDLLRIAGRVRDELVAEPFHGPSGQHRIGVTAGLADVAADEPWQEALERADHALVVGKSVQKNRCYPAVERLAIAEERLEKVRAGKARTVRRKPAPRVA